VGMCCVESDPGLEAPAPQASGLLIKRFQGVGQKLTYVYSSLI
jgi:hypothetical protein